MGIKIVWISTLVAIVVYVMAALGRVIYFTRFWESNEDLDDTLADVRRIISSPEFKKAMRDNDKEKIKELLSDAEPPRPMTRTESIMDPILGIIERIKFKLVIFYLELCTLMAR